MPRLDTNYNFFKIVNHKADLPSPSAGVITLTANTTYFIVNTIDLTGDRLVGSQNTTIIGGSSENCRIKSTGLTGTALISSAWSLPIRNITIEADIALSLDATANANQALDWFGVNFTDCGTVGTIKNYNNFIMTDCALLNSDGMTFDGSIGTIGFIQCLFDAGTNGTVITLPSTLTVTRRFRIAYCSFVVGSGETGLNTSTSASIPVEGYILDTVNFSGGGTYLTGVDQSFEESLFLNCRGITNTTAIGYYTMLANATATTISLADTAYKIAGTTTNSSLTSKFTHTNNRLTYTGAITRVFEVSTILSLTSTANNEIGIYVAKNGTIIAESETYMTANTAGKVENGAAQTLVELATNDYIEVFVENATAANDVTVEFMSVTAQAEV